MSEYICLLLTIAGGRTIDIFRIAIKIHQDLLGPEREVVTYYREPENQALLQSWLPSHCQSLGTIVEIRRIFEIHNIEDQSNESLTNPIIEDNVHPVMTSTAKSADLYENLSYRCDDCAGVNTVTTNNVKGFIPIDESSDLLTMNCPQCDKTNTYRTDVEAQTISFSGYPNPKGTYVNRLGVV